MSQSSTQTAAPLAHVVRGDLLESVHSGHLVVLAPDGSVRFALGDPDTVIWARSSLKPLQGAAMVRAGLELEGAPLALACASHSGEPVHLAGVRAILAGAGRTEADLQNTPDLPLGPAAALAWQLAGGHACPLTQNCSGKHAAMLATCVAAGWGLADYLAVGHPLQLAVRDEIELLTGVPVSHVTLDGCGAPLFSTTVLGLARAFGRIAAAPRREPGSPHARVAIAMNAHPELVGGTGRDATLAMAAAPGLVAKDGADGVYAAGLADGGSLAFKVLDGADRPRPAVLAAALAIAGLDSEAIRELGRTPVLGHGRPVGAITATFGPTPA
ncbi:asparaginase [Pengzhenrongella frigida]|uniref:Asparaginase n=1 Tax=Pengzhenrongella frigida TaxID=1259133 RepID=A0A4Q5MXV1_9MICO|nr:asparaginase [Cellulomonas sp. HLT2-17]RYV50582.1 asparaginase [Cellulomonas sp. HLT2-17]